MRIVGALAAAAAAIVLSGCESTAQKETLAAQSLLVGMPKTALLECAGAPTATAAADGLEYYTYELAGYETWGSPSVGVGVGSVFGGRRSFGAFGLGFPLYGYDRVDAAVCRTTFVLERDRVKAVRYSGAGPTYERTRLCHAIVAPCLPRPAN